MYSFLSKAQSFSSCSLSLYNKLIHHCFTLENPLLPLRTIHAQLIKLGLNANTYLCNRSINLYSKCSSPGDALKLFDEIPFKNLVSHNICLNILVRYHDVRKARRFFDAMLKRDVVSYNSMISGYVSRSCLEDGLKVFLEMQSGSFIRPSVHTFSIVVTGVNCKFYGRVIHGLMLRHGVDFACDLVVGNSVVDMYGRVGMLEYALGVFLCMEKRDLVSWNSLISCCCKLRHEDLALSKFWLMRVEGFVGDEYTVSTVINACSSLKNLVKGKQMLCLCVKMGFFSNTIVLSAAIDLFSKCNRMEDSVCAFDNSIVWDSALCNSMISCYARNGSGENAMQLFISTLRKNIRPTEFTLSCILGCASHMIPMERGLPIHSLVVKLGFESDTIVANSLVEMYSKYGSIDLALHVFANMGVRDLIAWNTMIMGLTINYKLVESLSLYKKLKESGLHPDKTTINYALLACSYGGLVDEGMTIFSSMKEEYGIIPSNEHYSCIVDMMIRAGRFAEAMNTLKTMPCKGNIPMWESVLRACGDYGDLKLVETVAEKMMELYPHLLLPYLVLAQIYEKRGRWERVVRVRSIIKEKGEKKLVDYSWIGIRNCSFGFKADDVFYHGRKDSHSVLRLLTWEKMFTTGRAYKQSILDSVP